MKKKISKAISINKKNLEIVRKSRNNKIWPLIWNPGGKFKGEMASLNCQLVFEPKDLLSSHDFFNKQITREKEEDN